MRTAMLRGHNKRAETPLGCMYRMHTLQGILRLQYLSLKLVCILDVNLYARSARSAQRMARA